MTVNDQHAISIAIATNLLRRQDLPIIERGKAYKALLDARNHRRHALYVSLPRRKHGCSVFAAHFSYYIQLYKGRLLHRRDSRRCFFAPSLLDFTHGSYLCKQKRLFLVDGFYSLTPELPKDRDRGLETAVTVLADFMEQVKYHAAGEYLVKIIFLADGEVYEILYAEPGKEAILNLPLARPEQEPPVRLIILVDAAQVSLLAIPNVRAYCLLDHGGNIQYLQEETAGSF